MSAVMASIKRLVEYTFTSVAMPLIILSVKAMGRSPMR